ncbi:MAG: low molecular weight phosphotyrosine protein phosphatase [Reyranella sp.]|nr:low molecular weight phosphotyrosine protein phosphatase [Reyranella sp.]
MKTGILFVCTGNTCRSPMAAGVMRSLVRGAGLEHAFAIDSAGTAVRQAGEPPSPLALEATARRGYDISAHRSRTLVAADLARFAHPLAMARTHLAVMRALAPPGTDGRPRLFLDRDVADPWGGTARDYDHALDLIEARCVDLLEQLHRTL